VAYDDRDDSKMVARNNWLDCNLQSKIVPKETTGL
jgi:hypothetical protein